MSSEAVVSWSKWSATRFRSKSVVDSYQLTSFWISTHQLSSRNLKGVILWNAWVKRLQCRKQLVVGLLLKHHQFIAQDLMPGLRLHHNDLAAKKESTKANYWALKISLQSSNNNQDLRLHTNSDKYINRWIRAEVKQKLKRLLMMPAIRKAILSKEMPHLSLLQGNSNSSLNSTLTPFQKSKTNRKTTWEHWRRQRKPSKRHKGKHLSTLTQATLLK